MSQLSERDELFRAGALEHRARGRNAPGGVVRLGTPWLRWSYRALLVLVIAGVLLANGLRTRETTTGPAIVDVRNGTFSALLPAAVAQELSKARAVRLELPRGAVDVEVLHAKPIEANTPTAGLPAPAQPALLLSGRVSRPPAGAGRTADGSRMAARMTVVLRSERVGGIIIRQIKSMLGRSGQAS
jgi:hypothetical protein